MTFKEGSERIAQEYKKSIITDSVLYAQTTPTEILKLLKAHLFSHVVNVSFGGSRRSLYTQVKGIPQGSILSPLLCTMYYGHVERLVFGSAKEGESSCLTGPRPHPNYAVTLTTPSPHPHSHPHPTRNPANPPHHFSPHHNPHSHPSLSLALTYSSLSHH